MIHNNIFFKIIPMLNKDGVFFGNYRTGIVGDDFNRKFYSGDKHFFP
jgi:murein tripeptide amidase MpaA